MSQVSVDSNLTYPPPGPERFVVTDNSLRNMSDGQTFAYVLAYAITFIKFLALSWILAIDYQGTVTEYTFFKTGTTSCNLFYDWNTNWMRWIYFFFSFNLIDVWMSCNIGKTWWGKLPIFTSVASVLLNAMLLLLTIMTQIYRCNREGLGDSGNACQDPRFCGVMANILDSANNCQESNPLGMPLWPTTLMKDLAWEAGLTRFFVFLILFVVGDIIKSSLITSVPYGLDIIQSTAEYAKETGERIQSGNLPKTIDSAQRLVSTKKRDINNNVTFFTIYKKSHKIFYVADSVFVWILGGTCIVWFGWFQQNIESFPRIFKASTAHLGFTELSINTVWFNLIFYTVLYGIVIGWVLLSRFGNIYSNWIAIVGCIIGILTTVLLGIAIVSVFLPQCNTLNSPHNPCTDPKRFCATFGGPNQTEPFWQDPRNGCKNQYQCDITYTRDQLQWNENFIVLCLFVLYAFIVFVQTLIASIVLEIRFREYVGTSKQHEYYDNQAVENRLTQNIVPDRLKESIVEKYGDSQAQGQIQSGFYQGLYGTGGTPPMYPQSMMQGGYGGNYGSSYSNYGAPPMYPQTEYAPMNPMGQQLGQTYPDPQLQITSPYVTSGVAYIDDHNADSYFQDETTDQKEKFE